MTITITAFAWVPPVAQGLVRDLPVRWALEEAGLDYRERLLSLGEHKGEAYLKQQPFGQVPLYEEDGLTLFESGAIVLHIAERSEALLPEDAARRARAKCWMFSALNTVEPFILFLNQLGQMKTPEARTVEEPVTAAVRTRLAHLASRLEGQDYLEDDFTAGDLLMTTVLRILRTSDLVRADPILARYQARCEARPAFQRALSAHMAPFHDNGPRAQA